MVIMEYLFGRQTRFVRYTFIVLLITVFLSSCSDLHFRKDSASRGFLETGEQMAKYNCRKNINPRDYEACISGVHANYNDAYKSSNLERR